MTDRDGTVALVTQWYAPEPATAPVWIARALRRTGWDVQVLTGVPNYPDGVVPEGYRAWRRSEEWMDNAPIFRTPLYPDHGRGAAGRVANYGSWAISASLMGQRALRRAQVSLVYSSPATAALPAMMARRRFGTPYVLMVQDIWPDSIFASGFLHEGHTRRVTEWTVGRFCSAAYRGAHSIAVISPGMKDLLVDRGVPASKVELVYNWVHEEVFHPADPAPGFRAALGVGGDDFMFMYAGNHGAAQDLATVIEAMRHIQDQASHIHLAMIGDGIEKQHLRSLAADRGLKRVHFLDARPTSEMTGLVAAADAHLVSLADDALFRITLPSKVQSILAAGRPILASAPGDAAEVVVRSGAGFAVPPGSPTALGTAMLRMAALPRQERDRMASAGLAAYQAEMSEVVGAAKLSVMLDRARSEVTR